MHFVSHKLHIGNFVKFKKHFVKLLAGDCKVKHPKSYL